jgi:hypothetical protein
VVPFHSAAAARLFHHEKYPLSCMSVRRSGPCGCHPSVRSAGGRVVDGDELREPVNLLMCRLACAGDVPPRAGHDDEWQRYTRESPVLFTS